jgi:hypothetical protein
VATLLGNIGNDFYTAFYEPDAVKRKEELQNWIKSATSEIQSLVEIELITFVEWVTQGRWTEDGWKQGEEKLHSIQNDYPLVMEITLSKLNRKKKYAGKLPDRVESKRQDSVNVSAKKNPANSTVNQHTTNDGGDDDYVDSGSNPNDDRSNSMNPNNEDYHAAMDNRSDQMNPNNDAYYSSRGR